MAGFRIDLLYDSAALAAPASFRSGIQQAADLLAGVITDNITVNIKVDYKGTGGGAAAGPDQGLFESYSLVRADLIGHATAGDHSFDALPTGSSIQGQSNVAVWNAQLKLFGLLSPNDTSTDDGSATFATDIDPNLLVGVALHELTHALGRVPYGPQPDIFDLFRFTSAGNRLFQDSIPATASYFSVDGGYTKLADYGQKSDPSDFLNSGVQGPSDPFNEFYNSKTVQHLSSVDLQQLDVLGFHVTAQGSWDLVASGASITGATFEYQISNAGTGTVVDSTTGIYLSVDSTITTSDTLLTTYASPSLSAGASDHEFVSLVSLVFPTNLTAGTYYLGAIADYNDHIAESVDTNNASNAVALVLGNSGNNTLTGTSHDDLMMGLGGNDVFNAGDGNDYLVGGAGADTFNGGAGIDTVSYETAKAGLMARLDNPAANTGEAAGDVYSSIENLHGSQFSDTLCGDSHSNVLTGGGGNDSLWGYGGGDTLDGGDGNDYLVGGAGADVFIGGAGIDTVSYYFAVTGLVARLDHPELNTGEASGDTYSGVENLYGSQFGDTLCGDSGSNVLTGWAGNDSLWGYGGGDTLDGGDGNDYLVGGAGADVFIGGAGIDTVSYYFAVTGLVARLDHPELNTGEASGDTYSGVENLYGSQFGDTLCGDSGSNVLTGWAGNDSLWGYGGGDTLDGGDGNDYLVGGPGPDTFIGGAGNDTVSYYFAGTGLTARLDHPELNTGEAAGDTYSGVENLYGSQFDDVLAGDANANVLTGWGGNDTFLFATAPSAANIDTIADFTVGADKIALDHTVFAALSVGALPSGEFFIGNAPQDSSDHIIYNAQTGALYYDPDGTGAVQTMQFATVSAGLNLHADCFLVV